MCVVVIIIRMLLSSLSLDLIIIVVIVIIIAIIKIIGIVSFLDLGRNLTLMFALFISPFAVRRMHQQQASSQVLGYQQVRRWSI